jgi:hypothetical protein
MKKVNSKLMLGLGALALSLAVLPATPAVAQTPSEAPTVDTTPFQETEDDFNNLGWLGALGLLGLANLFRKPRQEHSNRTYPGELHNDSAMPGRTGVSNRTDVVERPDQP